MDDLRVPCVTLKVEDNITEHLVMLEILDVSTDPSSSGPVFKSVLRAITPDKLAKITEHLCVDYPSRKNKLIMMYKKALKVMFDVDITDDELKQRGFMTDEMIRREAAEARRTQAQRIKELNAAQEAEARANKLASRELKGKPRRVCVIDNKTRTSMIPEHQELLISIIINNPMHSSSSIVDMFNDVCSEPITARAVGAYKVRLVKAGRLDEKSLKVRK